MEASIGEKRGEDKREGAGKKKKKEGIREDRRQEKVCVWRQERSDGSR